MSGLRDLPRNDATSFMARMRPPELVALPRVIRALAANEAGALSDEPIEAVQTRLVAAARGGDLAAAPRRDFRRIPEALFAGSSPLAHDEDVLHVALAEVDRRGRRSMIADLIRQYIEHFDANDPGVRALGTWLRARVDAFDWPWRNRSHRLRFFEPAFAPQHLAALALNATDAPRRVLSSEGLHDLSLTGGLGACAFGLGCAYAETQRGPPAVGPQTRLLDWARGERPYEMDGQWPAFVNSMLKPWASADPPDDLRRRISATLIAYAGDPRTAVRTRWAPIERDTPELFRLFRSWLARATVLQFLDVVGEVAKDDHWRYRRAFWLSYLDGRSIDDAWVAFGSSALPYARRMQARLGEQGREYGEVERGTGRSSDQSALLVKIGDMLIADWSHNGKYNVWLPGQAGRPGLHQSRYNARILDAAPLRESHNGSADYHWQQRLAETIRRATTVTVDRRRWRPER